MSQAGDERPQVVTWPLPRQLPLYKLWGCINRLSNCNWGWCMQIRWLIDIDEYISHVTWWWGFVYFFYFFISDKWKNDFELKVSTWIPMCLIYYISQNWKNDVLKLALLERPLKSGREHNSSQKWRSLNTHMFSHVITHLIHMSWRHDWSLQFLTLFLHGGFSIHN